MLKKIVIGAFGLLAAFGVSAIITKVAPKDAAGNSVSLLPLPKDAAGKVNYKAIGILAGLVGLGTLAVSFLAQKLKISFLKN